MTSKIINMADKIKDAEDRFLESMFRSEPIADDGFSNRIITRIRQRIWLRRLALPMAMLVGGAIAIKPLLQVASVLSQISAPVSQVSIALPDTLLSQLPVMLGVGSLLIIGMLTFRISEA